MKARVASLADLAPDKPKCATFDGEDVVLLRRGDEVLAVSNICPHQGGSICDGWAEGDILVCPLHGWEFDSRSGACMTIPGERIPAYAASIENGDVYLERKSD
jgi:nitrite reductase (NADH) small subunit